MSDEIRKQAESEAKKVLNEIPADCLPDYENLGTIIIASAIERHLRRIALLEKRVAELVKDFNTAINVGLSCEIEAIEYKRMWNRVKQIRAEGCLLTSEDLEEIEKQALNDNHTTT